MLKLTPAALRVVRARWITAVRTRFVQPQHACAPPLPPFFQILDLGTLAGCRAREEHDAPGLLHRVGTAIAGTGTDITAARVSTLGSEVVDVFFLVDRRGEPLAHDLAHAVAEAVEEALAEAAD